MLSFYKGKVADYITKNVRPQLTSNHVLLHDFHLEQIPFKDFNLDKSKIYVIMSIVDWDSSNHSPKIHQYIKENTKHQIYIGNRNNENYFNYWVEFIRQHPRYFFDETYIDTTKLTKLYLSYNRRSAEHRVYLLEQLKKCELITHGIVSQFDQSVGELSEHVLNMALRDSKLNFPNDIHSLGDPNIWQQCLINVVTETTLYTDVFLSEKTWKPIVGMRPFLILGDYNIYSKLKQLGFDTFDDIFGDWWKENDWKKRADSIVFILKSFANDDLHKMYQSLQPRLVNNRQRFTEYMIENHNKFCNLNLQ